MPEGSPVGLSNTRVATGQVGLTSEEIDAAKGLAILLIVLSHNTVLMNQAPWLPVFLYSFHVFFFVLLPFLYAPCPLKCTALANRFVRYLVPYFMLLLLFSPVFYWTERRQDGPGAWLADAVVGLMIASTVTLRRGCGFQSFWFLPTLMTLTLSLSVSRRLGSFTRLVCLSLLCALHLVIGDLPPGAKAYLPWGLPIVIYVLPLGFLAAAIWPRCCKARPAASTLVSLPLFAGLAAVMAWRHTGVDLGDIKVFSIRSPLSLAVHDAIAVLGFLVILGLSPVLRKARILTHLGRWSLVVYLVHAPITHCCFSAGMKLGLFRVPGLVTIVAGLADLLITISGCLLVIRLFSSCDSLRRAIFPRSVPDWLAAAWLTRTQPSGTAG